jgi:hypothetical protein
VFFEVTKFAVHPCTLCALHYYHHHLHWLQSTTEDFSTGQPTSCHFMLIWEENLPKSDYGVHFSLLLQSWCGNCVLLCFVLCDRVLMARGSRNRALSRFVSSCPLSRLRVVVSFAA